MMDGTLTSDYEDNMNGEPDAMKAACPVRKGIERKGLVTVPRSQSTLLLAKKLLDQQILCEGVLPLPSSMQYNSVC
jgi:hypothetical protein